MEMNLTSSEKRRGITRFLLMSVLFSLLILPTWAQDRVTVSGHLTGGAGMEPLAGATIMEKGGTNGVTADADGNYEISVKGNAVLEFSFIGYTTKEQAVQNRTQIDVNLEEDATMIGEVVAIGYGSQRKEDLSMAVTTVKVDDATRSRAGDLGTILQGRMPGVTVQQSGDPMQKTSFSIRGRGSKGNDDGTAKSAAFSRDNVGQSSGDGVLVVVDGVPNAPYMTEDIETITILKDAASAAIYGASVGSSGVILITTRKAQAGQTRVSVNVSLGMEKVSNVPSMLNAAQFCEVWAKAVSNTTNASLPNLANPEVYAGANITRTDWFDEIYRTSLTQHYGVSISGGTDVLTSIFSVTYDKKEGTLLNTWAQNLGAKLNTEYRPNKWLKISERVSFEYSNGQGNVSTSHTGPLLGALWFPTSASIYDLDTNGNVIYGDDGKPKWGGVASSADIKDGVVGPNTVNPVAQLQTMRRRYPRTKIFSTTGVEVKPITSLTLKSEFTADLDTREEDEYSPKIDVPSGNTVSSREQFNYNNFHYLWETTASWAQVFGKHHISAMAGFTTDYRKNHYRDFRTEGYKGDGDHELVWGTVDKWSKNPAEDIHDQSMVSVLGRIGYSFDDRYFLVGSIRRDASSKLPKSKNYDLFPSVSGSWKLSSEKFFSNSSLSKIFDLVKFRAGWGKVGNVELYNMTSVTNIPLLKYPDGSLIGGSTHYGTYLETIPNDNARWETTEQTSAGVDLTMFKNKLDISIDYYDKNTKDLVDYVPTPSQTGINKSPMGNMGNVINKGWEFSVSYKNTAAEGKFNYNVWGTFSTNKGHVVEYGPQEYVWHSNPSIAGSEILASGAGYPWYSYRIYRTGGIFRSQKDIEQHVTKDPVTGEVKALQPTAQVGDLIYLDTNGDGSITDADRVLTGSNAPKQTFSFGGSFDWKGFDFNFIFQGVAGNYIYNANKQLGMAGRDYGNLMTDVYNTWDFNPVSSKYPRLGIAKDDNGNYLKFSDIFLEKGDYLRLKNITLGYTLPKNITRHIGLAKGSMRVYVSVDNVATITGYTGVDPEVGNYGVDSGVYPVSRFYNFGVNVNF